MLYDQLATSIRYRIASGELRAGDRLPSLREAGTSWGVSLHTVRRAYHTLADEGLIEVPDRKRPRVLSHRKNATRTAVGNASLKEFVLSVAQTARQQFDVSATDLARMIESAPDITTIVVVECTHVLSAHLANQLQRELGVAVTAKVLTDSIPRTGLVIGTYYHYREIAQRTRGRAEVLFLTLEVEPECIAAIRARLGRGRRIVICGPDTISLEAMAADLRGHFPAAVEIQPIASRKPSHVIEKESQGGPVVLTPEAWEALPASKRASANIIAHLSRFTAEALREAREYRVTGSVRRA